MKKINTISILSFFVAITTLTFCAYEGFKEPKVNVSATVTEDYSSLSNKKICWGIKRSDNHEQPDIGKENKSIIDKYNALGIGNAEKKYLYLTFDAGYEAGYTEKILDVLKQNNITATFFVTGHYVNTQPELIQKMIEGGNIVGNHAPNCLMSGIKIYKN